MSSPQTWRWLRTFRPNLRSIALPPSTPDSPTRTRPGTAGPTTWVSLQAGQGQSSQLWIGTLLSFLNEDTNTFLTSNQLNISSGFWGGGSLTFALNLDRGHVLFIILIVVIVSLLIDYHRCQKALDAKGVDTAPCDWYKRVYKSLCPISWVN